MFVRDFQSPFGVIRLESDSLFLTGCRISANTLLRSDDHSLLLRAQSELEGYFSKDPAPFTVPLHPSGTAFQKLVWNALLEIPRGETRTYGDITREIGKEKAFQAVGRACGANPIWFFIPCHRVVGANGALTGYAGGAELKRLLLALEKRT